MQQPVATAPLPPLPYRTRPPQVLLGVGAVLMVSAGAAVASAYGGPTARVLLLVLAAVLAGCSLRAARDRLRSSEEVLAACATGLALSGSAVSGSALGGAATATGFAAAFLLLRRLRPSTATWPLASWGAGQVAVLETLDAVPAGLRTLSYLGVALAGLAIALSGRPVVARIALLTTVPWWVAGVVGGLTTAWTGPGAERSAAAALVVVAGLGLVATRLRQELERLTGPPWAPPVLAGIVGGAAVAGAASTMGTAAITAVGYSGVLLATLAAVLLTGRRRGLFLPLALAAGTVMILLSVGQLLVDRQWTALSVLLLLTAVPTVWVAVRRPEDRPVSLPVAVWCLAGAVLLAVPAGALSPTAAALALTAVQAAAMAAGAGLARSARRATAVAAAVCAATAVLLVVARDQPGALAAVLAVQGLSTLGWAWRTGRTEDDVPLSRSAWRVGAALLVAGAWVAAGAAGLGAVEWYSLPAAAGLLVAAGPALGRGSSWATWGPGLLVAAVPSTVLAVVATDAPRAIVVLVVAAVALVTGGRRGLRAPLEVGAGAALALALGLGVRALPWPVASALVVGGVLLAVGARKERSPVAGFAIRLADLR